MKTSLLSLWVAAVFLSTGVMAQMGTEGAPGADGAAQQGMPAADTERAGEGLTPEDFTRLDQAGDGYITRQEAEADPHLSAQFDEIDRDGDGRIDEAEFAQFLAEEGMDDGDPQPEPGRLGN